MTTKDLYLYNHSHTVYGEIRQTDCMTQNNDNPRKTKFLLLLIGQHTYFIVNYYRVHKFHRSLQLTCEIPMLCHTFGQALQRKM